MTTRAIIPVKGFENAKQRLSALLSGEERRRLCQAMMEDVLIAVEACPLVDEVMVITNDLAAIELAEGYGALILPEPAEAGLIPAVVHASQALTEAGIDQMLFLPGDVPLVTPEELEVILDGFSPAGPGLALVPADDLGGTNCLLASPPGVVDFQFGIDSFRKHVKAAQMAGLEPTVLKLPGLGLDIDTPDDLKRFMDRLAFLGTESHTYRYCVAIDVSARLSSVTGGGL